MNVTVNGEARDVPAGLTVAGLLRQLGITANRVAIERNLAILPRARWDDTAVESDDRYEIVHLVGGGADGPAPQRAQCLASPRAARNSRLISFLLSGRSRRGRDMRRRLTVALAQVLVTVLALTPAARAAPLTPKQQKVLDYLVANWGKDTAVTGIDLAMQILGGQYTPEDRFALAVHIRGHPEVHNVIRRFGWEPVALTPNEKLIARQLSWAEREKRPAPSLAELGRSVGIEAGAISDALRMLDRFGIIRRDPAAGGVGYRMASHRYVTWEGPGRIDFMYHRVQVEGREPLDTY